MECPSSPHLLVYLKDYAAKEGRKESSEDADEALWRNIDVLPSHHPLFSSCWDLVSCSPLETILSLLAVTDIVENAV